MLTIYRSEGSASLRRVPVWLVDSTGTNPVSADLLQPQITWHGRTPIATVNTAATLSLVSANAGLHQVELSASEVSALGIFSIHARSATAIAQTVFGQIVNYDSGDSMRFGQFALPNAAAEAAGGLVTAGTGANQISLSAGSVGLRAQLHSQATVGGADNLTGRIYSTVTIRPDFQNYSGVTVRLDYQNYSGVTVRPDAQNYSGVTVRVDQQDYSAVTVRVMGIVAASFNAGAIDAAALATDAGQEIADRMLLRNIATGDDSGRSVAQALFALRSRVLISGSTGTVFQNDDTTSSWTFSVVTAGGQVITDFDPGGA